MRISDWSSDVCSSDLQPFGMLGQLEDAAVVDALALEHARGVVQRMAEDVQGGVLPRHQCAVVPDVSRAVIEAVHGCAPVYLGPAYSQFCHGQQEIGVDRKSTRLNSSH